MVDSDISHVRLYQGLTQGDAVLAAHSLSLYVGGQWLGAPSRFAVFDPATGDQIGSADDAEPEHAVRAVDAAAAAAREWRETPAAMRSDLLRAVAAGIRRDVQDLAIVLTRENGKPLRESRAELLGCAQTLEWCGEEARRVYGRLVPLEPRRRGMVWKQPVGVVVGISPWNFPASMLVRKIGLALAAGCTMIAKPAEQTPLIATALTRLFDEVGCPPGVVNQLTTSRPAAIVDTLLADDRVAKVSFTGSTEVGRMLVERGEGRLKNVSLELGGHAPGIVFADADLSAAVEGIVGAKLRNAGQSCVALNRLYVHSSIAHELVELLTKRVEGMSVGPGLDETAEVGPLIDAAALRKLSDQIEDARSRGATVVTGGNRLATEEHAAGMFYAPTLLTGVTEHMTVSRQEIFGPMLPIYEFDEVDDAVDLSNETEYGLAAYLYGRDISVMWRVAERLEFGIVGINDPFPVAPELPFGGCKNSGLGREGGSEGIAEYVTTKAVTIAI